MLIICRVEHLLDSEKYGLNFKYFLRSWANQSEAHHPKKQITKFSIGHSPSTTN
jgi:hypothetical protein